MLDDGELRTTAGADGRYVLTVPDILLINTVHRPTRVHGRVMNDSNFDARPDIGDEPRPGAVVFIDADNDGMLDAGERSVTTAADGSWSIDQPTLADRRGETERRRDEVVLPAAPFLTSDLRPLR